MDVYEEYAHLGLEAPEGSRSWFREDQSWTRHIAQHHQARGGRRIPYAAHIANLRDRELTGMPRQSVRAYRRRGFTRPYAAYRGAAVGRARARATLRGRYAGYYRKSGYYGRFRNTGGELKFHDVDNDDAVVDSGGSVTNSINLIAQGVTESTRVGRKCVIRGINWRGEVFLPVTTVTSETSDVVRLIMFLDKQANGATAAVTDLLETADYQSFNNLSNKNRFTVLYDKMVAINSIAGGGDVGGANSNWGAVNRTFSFYKKCSIPIEFSSTTGAITEIRSNNLGILYIGKNGLAGVASKIRLRFSDG